MKLPLRSRGRGRTAQSEQRGLISLADWRSRRFRWSIQTVHGVTLVLLLIVGLGPTLWLAKAAITPTQSLSLLYKHWQWVSSTGKVPYFDSTYDLTYKRKLTSQLSLDLGARFLESDYTSGYAFSGPATAPTKKTNPRDDTQTTLSIGLTYAFNSHVSVNLAYSSDLGRNVQENIDAQTRDFNRNLVSLGANLKF